MRDGLESRERADLGRWDHRPRPRASVEPSASQIGDDEEDEDAALSDDDDRVLALSAFNHRHASRSTHARELLTALQTSRNVDWRPLGDRFEDYVAEVFRNRLFRTESYNPFEEQRAPPPKRRPRRRKWRLDDSIWHARKLQGNSRSYYETHESMRTLFDTDWGMASVGIAKMVERADERGKQWLDVDGNGVHDAIDDAGVTLWMHHKTIYGAFDYYSALLDSGKDSHGEIEIFSISYNAYTEFARDCGLVCAACPLRTFDLIWTAVNALPHDAIMRQSDRWNHKRMMCRHEFLQALVRIASALYVETGVEGEVAVAVSKLCSRLQKALPPEALQDSNAFRKQRCYNELCDMALRRHQPSLRAIFDVYARSNRNTSDELQDSRQMSVGEWLTLLEHVGLLQMGQVSYFGAKMTFKWSLIRACSDTSAKEERKMRHLMFVDFLEALVRVACTMALPTDADLEAAGADDAAEYLHGLIAMGEGQLDEFVSTRKVGWRAQPRQHISRCVHHLVSLLVRTVKHDVSGGSTDAPRASRAPVDEGEVGQFEVRRRRGRCLSYVQSKASLLDGIRAAASIVRGRLLGALRKVEIFNDLADEQLDVLCSAMSHAPFDEGQYVFEQGEEGNDFYIITEGVAAVLRTEEDSHEERELGILGEGAFFGERALIKSQVRYAGIRAESAKLHTVFITREQLEAALGAPLESFVPDQYRLDEAELLQRLASVPLFAPLSPAQIKLVADRCTEVVLKKGTAIVRQGEVGDTFFILTRGTADVLHVPPPNDGGGAGSEHGFAGTATGARGGEGAAPAEPRLLASLGAWQAFGERALLKKEPRYANVCVTSDEISLMSISRNVFEAALGLKLDEVLTTQH